MNNDPSLSIPEMTLSGERVFTNVISYGGAITDYEGLNAHTVHRTMTQAHRR